ncbi:hypothetical protein SPB21_18960 [Leptothoe sp. ISB3NOV94-8A]
MVNDSVARSRRRDPDYIQNSIELHKILVAKIKGVCVMRELNMSEAVEEALISWLKSIDEDVPDFPPPKDFEDGRRKP